MYQEWCGPCCVMAPILKDLKMRLSDDSLHCAIVNLFDRFVLLVYRVNLLADFCLFIPRAKAKADYITQLVKFRGRSEPTWLFMAVSLFFDF